MKTLSDTIKILRFPLMCLVVFIHSDVSSIRMEGIIFNHNDYPCFRVIYMTFSQMIAVAAVPLFFMISGFLYFYKVNSFGLEVWKYKTKKRIFSLFVPYIIWNSITLLFYYVVQQVLPNMVSGENMDIRDFSIIDFVLSFWDTSSLNSSGIPHPIAHHLWFVRDLIVVSILSPIVYAFVKWFKAVGIFLLCILWLFRFETHLPGLSMIAIIPFSIGAYYSLNSVDFGRIFSTFAIPLIPIYMIGLFFENMKQLGDDFGVVIHQLDVIMGVIIIVGLAYKGVSDNEWNFPDILPRSSFFLFCYHFMPLNFLMKVLVKLLRPDSSIGLVLIYLTSPIIIIILGVFLYWIIEKYFNRMLLLVSGKR